MEVWTCSHPPLPQFVGTEDTFIFGSDADEDTAYDERDWRRRQPFLVTEIRPSMAVEALA